MVDPYFDHAQSPRLGQPVPAEHTSVLMFDGAELPEISWFGQLIYRSDLQILQVFNGTAYEDVVGGVFGILTFVGPAPPISEHPGDLWFDTSDQHKLYRAAITGADAITTGEWELVRDQGIDAALTAASDAAEAASNALAQADAAFAAAHDNTMTFFQTSAPTGTSDRPLRTDDLWYDTDDGYKQYRYDGSTWVTFDVTISDFSLTARKFVTTTHLLY
jgi:hypothetical protein